MKQLFILSILLGSATLSHAQKARLKYADKMFESQSYYFASEGYEDVLERRTDSLTVANRIAESYDKIGSTEKAVEWYRFIQRNNQLNKDQLLRLALLERELENYGTSETLLANYSNQYGAIDVTKTAKQNNVEKLQKLSDQFSLVNQDVNTSHSEIGATYVSKDQILLASSKRSEIVTFRQQGWTGDHFYDMYVAQIDENGAINSKLKRVKMKANAKFHDGPATYNPNTGYVYFTRNNFLNGKKGMDENRIMRLKIYRATLDGRKLKDVTELAINGDQFSTAHPSISKDGKRLYFSSDRPGGLGGMDIYYVNIDESGLPQGAVVNMGDKINTSQNEIFPNIHSDENLLFFSSEGHVGLGGLDIYAAKLNSKSEAKSISNLGSPINSPSDDFSFVTNADQTRGYFSSNRKGGEGDDDIYGFVQKYKIRNSAVVEGEVTDLLTKAIIPGATVHLVDGSGNVLDSTKTAADGSYAFNLSGITNDFKVVAKNEDYANGEGDVAFSPEVEEYKQDVQLMPRLNYYFSGLVTDRQSKAALDGVKVTLFDQNEKDEVTHLTTSSDGKFKKPLPYTYNEKVGYTFKFEKEGYVTKFLSVSEQLLLDEEIDVNDRLSLAMMKIEVGKTDLNDVVEIKPIYFDLNKADIRPDAAIELNKIVEVMKQNPQMEIELGSHTDSRGSDAANRSLSDRRAKSSADYIVSQGISRDRIKGKGYGESKLKVSDKEIANAATEEEKEILHQKNRRTEFIITKMR